MELIEGVKLALQSLWANKMRSILTLLGVVIGVASVIMVVTLTNGAKDFVTTKINTYGAGVITISKMPQTFITIDEYLAFQKRRDITLDDYRAVLSECSLCVSVGARRSATRHASSTATTPAPIPTFAAGPGPCLRSPTSTSNWAVPSPKSKTTHSAHVAIVGSDIVDNLLGPGDPLGKEIRVAGAPYTVIGVGERQGKMFGQSMDNWVAIPLTAFLEQFGSHQTMTIYVDAGGGGEVMDNVIGRAAHHHAHPPPSCTRRGRHLLHRYQRHVSRICSARSSTASAPSSRPSPASLWSSAASSS